MQSALASYPHRPGYKAKGTSQKAANETAQRAPTLRQRIIAIMWDRDLTTDEAADILGVSVLAVRPRFTELALTNMIRRTGATRLNRSGKHANVWSLSTSS